MCPNCGIAFCSQDKRRRFCSRQCVGQWTARDRTSIDDEQKHKISASLKRFYKENPDRVIRGTKMAELVSNTTRGKFGQPRNIFNMSKRTTAKILRRLHLSCSKCGWDEEICDLHHIHGRKIDDHNNHNNLTVLCPNCHRLAHANKISVDELITLEQQIGDSWLEAYYG